MENRDNHRRGHGEYVAADNRLRHKSEEGRFHKSISSNTISSESSLFGRCQQDINSYKSRWRTENVQLRRIKSNSEPVCRKDNGEIWEGEDYELLMRKYEQNTFNIMENEYTNKRNASQILSED